MVLSTRPLSTRHEVEDERAAQDFLHEKGWTDGLPVIPPPGAGPGLSSDDIKTTMRHAGA
jgi:hypothetical protein